MNFVVTVLTLLVSALGFGGAPVAPPPVSPPASEWAAWVDDQPGVTRGDRDFIHSAEHQGEVFVVWAEDAMAAGVFADAVQERASRVNGRVTMNVVLEVPGGVSVVRLVPGATPASVWDLLDAPLPADATARLTGFDENMSFDPHHPIFQGESSAEVVRYFGGDIVDVTLEAQAPPGFLLGVTEAAHDEPHYRKRTISPTESDRARGIAAAIGEARSLGFDPAVVEGGIVKFHDRDTAIRIARTLPGDTPITIVGSATGHEFFLRPTSRLDYLGAPTRDELIEWAAGHPEVKVLTATSGLEITLYTVADCRAFLDTPPAWDLPLDLACELPDGRFAAEGAIEEVLALMPRLESMAADGGRINVADDGDLTIHEGRDLGAQLERVRELGWEGTVSVSLNSGDGERTRVKFESTSTGRAMNPSGGGDRGQRLIDAWNASATG